MTKLKNTKKGMAKKALSISLVAAMLATSNVPVWAAEFSDGTDVAPVVVENNADVEAFSDDASEAPAIDNEIPVEGVDEVEDLALPSSKDTLAVTQSGWANYITKTGKVYDSNGFEMTAYLYAWEVDGKVGNRPGVDYGYCANVNDILNYPGANHYQATAADVGKEIVYKVYNYDGEMPNSPDFAGRPDNYVTETAPVVIGKTDVNSGTVTYKFDRVKVYNGKKQPIPTVYLQDEFTTGVRITEDDFLIECHLIEGDGIDAESIWQFKATPKDSSLYTNTLRFDYKIVEKDYAAGDISATYISTPKTYEYTGKKIVPETEDLKLFDEVGQRHKELDPDVVIDDITVCDANGLVATVPAVGQTYTAYLNVENVQNFTENSLKNNEMIPVKGGFTVTARDLSNCDVTIDTLAFNGNPIIATNDPRFKDAIRITDKKTGEELNLKSALDVAAGAYDYDIIVTELPSQGTKNYKVTLQAPTGTNASGNTKGSTVLEFTIGNHTFADRGYHLEKSVIDELQHAVAYTGSTAVKNTSKIVYKDNNGNILSPNNYSVAVYGTDAGTKAGKVVITGLLSYEGFEETYYFNIMPAYVEISAGHKDVSAISKVVYDKGYTKASQYAPKVTVKACKAKEYTPNVWISSKDQSLTLTEDDFKVTYSFKDYNKIGRKIICKVKITNKNFKGGETSFEIEDTTISRRQLANCTVEVVPGSYTYTGGIIKPTLKVMDGIEELTEGVDYEIYKYENAVDVGTATVYLKGVDQNNSDDGQSKDGIYDPAEDTGTKASFQITPANASDVVVTFVGGNTGIKYTGTNLKPTVATVTLDGNDVSRQFKITYPETNINVGKGHITLIPVTGNKNFTGTKDAEFDITPRELYGTLKVYDENDVQYTVSPYGELMVPNAYGQLQVVTFAYDGKEHTFKSAEFVPDPSNAYSKYVTEDDYEIKYVDNVYGEKAYIYVLGKGNFKGTDTITDANGDVVDVITSVVDKKTFLIEKYDIKKQHVTIEDGEYAAGQPVRPNVKVVVGGRELVENQDYVLRYTAKSDLTNGKTLKVVVEGVNGYQGIVEGYWGVVKRDMANTQIILDKEEYKKNETPVATVYNNGIMVPSSEYSVTYADGFLTVTANSDSKYYTGTQNVKVRLVGDVAPATPVVSDVTVVGNKATVVLADALSSAEGYDFVIGKDRDCITSKEYSDVNKNEIKAKTTFQYVQAGTYYAYCHAWIRDENGKKVFSEWSNAMPFVVSAVTPDIPKITNVKVSGSTVTVTYTECANATGYDLVLGSSVKKVNGEKRPVEYGTLVKKIKKGNTVKATFKDVPAGSYYVGLHAWNRTSADGKKVFSPWSAAKRVTVK